MHKEIVFLEDAEEFAISLLQKIGNFRHQQAAQQANGADAEQAARLAEEKPLNKI